MAGARPATYWFSSLCFDFCLHALVAVAVTLIVWGMDDRHLFDNNGAAGAFFTINLLYGFGGLLLAYVCTFVGKTAPGGYTFYLITALLLCEYSTLAAIRK